MQGLVDIYSDVIIFNNQKKYAETNDIFEQL